MEPKSPRKITRNRELRACVECRRRKLKCDHQMPCASCARHGATPCVYERNPKVLQSERSRRLQAESRLEHLECLIQEFSPSGRTPAGNSNPASLAFQAQNNRDVIPEVSPYNGATHWSAMLEDVEELRAVIQHQNENDHLDLDLEVDVGGDDQNDISLLFGAAKQLSIQQVLQRFLPTRQETDRLVAAYFRAKAIAAPFLHPAHFNRFYRRFWDNPSESSPLWTSILFSILDIATRTIPQTSRASAASNSKIHRFAKAAAHCLSVGEYHRPQPFAVEALLIYAQSKILTTLEMPQAVVVLFGTIVRLATLMGYHRDADGYRKSVSAFKGEMRRRAWSLCMQLDMLVSFQLGLPSNIQFPTWDTRPPTNLLDSDFDEDTVQLPSARPDSEPTELLFWIAKHKLMAVFEKIIRHTLASTDQSDDELELIDQELRNTYNDLPTVFHPRLMADSIVDSPSIVVARLCVYFIYHKCLCVLHRKWVIRGRQSSVRICYDASSSLVRQLLDIHEEFEPGGQLETERWFMGGITWHDFLLGCTTLCLTLCSTKSCPAELACPATVDIECSLELLRKARSVCEKHFAGSKDMRKVQRLMDASIREFSGPKSSSVPTTQGSSPNGQDVAFHVGWQATSFAQGDEDWHGNENTVKSMDDSAWAYMEQFLYMPEEDVLNTCDSQDTNGRIEH